MKDILKCFLGVLLFAFFTTELVNGQIEFPSGEVFDNEAEVKDVNYVDPERSTSPLFKVNHSSSRRLSLNIPEKQWTKAATQAAYYRAHPIFIQCLQSAWTDLQQQNLFLNLISGYKSGKDVDLQSTRVQDIYSRTGTGAHIKLTNSQDPSKDLRATVRALLRYCPVPFSEIGRDLGVVLMADSLFVYMTGTQHDSYQSFTLETRPTLGFENSAAFAFWSQTTLDQVFDLDDLSGSNCTGFLGVESGAMFPPGEVTAANVVGPVDEVVTRFSNDDFRRLIQYPANNMDFEDAESSSTWCGTTAVNCVNCRNGVVGNSLKTRCADRTMSPRMFQLMRKLQKLARNDASVNSKIKVLEAWDEPHSGAPTGDSQITSLHREGRRISLQLTSGNTPASLKALSSLALCAGFSWVRHRGDRLDLAVPKQATLKTTEVNFPEAQLMPVEPPTSVADSYHVYSKDEMDPYPLYDGAVSDRIEIASDTPMSIFRSKDPDVRYMRIQPALATCFSALNFRVNTVAGSTPANGVHFKIVRGFISTLEQASLFDPIMDERTGAHVLGLAMHVNYDTMAGTNSKELQTLWRLAEQLGMACAPIFLKAGKMMGIGVYKDGVYVDMRDEYKGWVDCSECQDFHPVGQTQSQFLTSLQERVAMAIRGRLIQPDDMKHACLFDNAPTVQSADFSYHQPEADRLVSLEVATNDPEVVAGQCQVQSNTEFCRRSSNERKRVVDELWSQIKLKYIRVGENKLREALDGCLGVCGTCSEGAIWEGKQKHCSNLIHWIPFGTLNDEIQGAITNFYSRGDVEARNKACHYNNHHCVDKSPLFSILFPTFDALFSWEPNKAPKAQLYDTTENPSPLMRNIMRIYALNARNYVHLWLRKESEIGPMEDALKVAFVYNKNITEIRVHFLDPMSKASIISVLENYLQQWATSGCPATSRVFLTPYALVDSNVHAVYRRSVDSTCRDEIAMDLSRWQTDGLFGNLL